MWVAALHCYHDVHANVAQITLWLSVMLPLHITIVIVINVLVIMIINL